MGKWVNLYSVFPRLTSLEARTKNKDGILKTDVIVFMGALKSEVICVRGKTPLALREAVGYSQVGGVQAGGGSLQQPALV